MPRTRRRWLIVAAAVVALATLCVLWVFRSDDAELLRRASLIRIGMTKAEVAQVMGDIQAPMGIYGGYVGGGGIWYGEQHWTKGRRLKEDLSFYFGITFKVDYDDYPVNIQFERGDHVVRIKRGADIVTATAAEITATHGGHGAPRPRPTP